MFSETQRLEGGTGPKPSTQEILEVEIASEEMLEDIPEEQEEAQQGIRQAVNCVARVGDTRNLRAATEKTLWSKWRKKKEFLLQ